MFVFFNGYTPWVNSTHLNLLFFGIFAVGTFVQRLLFGNTGDDAKPIPLMFPPTVDHLRARFERKYGYRGQYLIEQLGNGYFRYSSGYTPCFSCKLWIWRICSLFLVCGLFDLFIEIEIVEVVPIFRVFEWCFTIMSVDLKILEFKFGSWIAKCLIIYPGKFNYFLKKCTKR